MRWFVVVEGGVGGGLVGVRGGGGGGGGRGSLLFFKSYFVLTPWYLSCFRSRSVLFTSQEMFSTRAKIKMKTVARKHKKDD